jgi:hypothetical protein
MNRHCNLSVFALSVFAFFVALIIHGAIGAADRMEPTRVLSTNPSQVQLDRVERVDHISRGFARLEDGTYAIALLVEYRDSFDRIQREFLRFHLVEGQIVQEGDNLFLHHPELAGEKILVGLGKWWFSPRWQAAGRGAIEVKTERHLRTMMLSTWLEIH